MQLNVSLSACWPSLPGAAGRYVCGELMASPLVRVWPAVLTTDRTDATSCNHNILSYRSSSSSVDCSLSSGNKDSVRHWIWKGRVYWLFKTVVINVETWILGAKINQSDSNMIQGLNRKYLTFNKHEMLSIIQASEILRLKLDEKEKCT